MTQSEGRARGGLLPGLGLIGLLVFLTTPLASFQFPSATGTSSSDAVITHGPILGRLSHDGIGVWVRTSKPSRFQVTCRIKHVCVAQSPIGETRLENDNTGWVQVTGLKPDTTYDYEVVLDSGAWTQGGSFATLPDKDSARNPQNPAGLFNFSFEFACGNQQNLLEDPGPSLPTYKTMYEKLKGRIHFQIMNGDWLYEDKRDHPVSAWQQTNQVTDSEVPDVVRVAPTIVGVWENYKLYLSRSVNLARWHRNIPTFFVYDDHEMINDINGTNNPGFRNRKAVFRDIGIRAWRDYVGWSNPLPDPDPQEIWFGRADLTEGSDILVDKQSDFSKLDLDRATNLMVHWGTPTAGVMDDPPDDAGHPAAGVYKLVKILDRNRLQITPAPRADGEQVSYSIGMRNYYRLSVGNCDFFVLDCRGLRQLHNKKNPWEKGLSMLSLEQKDWLKKGMSESAADFLFVVSSVNLTIPHVGPGPPDKDEAWTVYMEEREELIKFWDNLLKPVMVLTGDLHNSFVIKITDRVWEFGSGPHNSGNHSLMDEAMRPPSGDFEYNGRKVNIRWSTFLLDDVDYFPNKLKLPIRPIPCYCVVRVNNCFNNPKEPGGVRWVAYPQPQVIFQYFDGLTGELLYAEAIGALKSGSEKAPSERRSEKMKALLKARSEPGAELRDVPVPEPRPDEVLIRVKATAICGTDLHIFAWDPYAQERIKPPMIFGHEGCGEVVRVGSRVSGYETGDLIAVETHIPCGECFQCRTGSQHICERMAIIGVHTDGIFAEYARIPMSCCWKLPRDTNPDLGAILEPLGVAINGLLKEDINNKTVAIFGLGPIGQFGLAAASFWGASRIFAVEPNAYRLEMAKKLVPKATFFNPSEGDEVKAILEATAGRGVDISLEISGDPKAIQHAFKVVRKAGRVSLIGLPSRSIELDITADIIYKEARVYGSTGRLMWKTWYDAQKLLDSGSFDPTPIITHRFPLEKYDQALSLAGSRQAGKILLYP